MYAGKLSVTFAFFKENIVSRSSWKSLLRIQFLRSLSVTPRGIVPSLFFSVFSNVIFFSSRYSQATLKLFSWPSDKVLGRFFSSFFERDERTVFSFSSYVSFLWVLIKEGFLVGVVWRPTPSVALRP